MPKHISVERVKQVLSYDPITGYLTRLESRGNAKAGTRAGTITGYGYLATMVDGVLALNHQWAWLVMSGTWPVEVDHRNGIRTDNRWSNLRDGRGINAQNRRTPRPDNRTGWLGVSPRAHGRFAAILTVGGRKKTFGIHDTAEQAHAAYIAAKREIHPGCTL